MKKAGWAVTGLALAMILMSAVMKLLGGKELETGFAHLGYSPQMALPLALLELACVAVYLVPRTRYVGAILLTGYLGGAIATHVRVGDPFIGPLVLGVLVWVGLVLTDSRARLIVPGVKQG